MSDKVWILQTAEDKWAFTTTRDGDVFTLHDALCHLFFGINDVVGLIKRTNYNEPGCFSNPVVEYGHVHSIDRVHGVLTLGAYHV